MRRNLINKLFLEPCDIVIVILSQKEHHHIDLANYLRERIYDQADILRKVCYVTSKSFLIFYYDIDIIFNLYILTCIFYILGIIKNCVISSA